METLQSFEKIEEVNIAFFHPDDLSCELFFKEPGYDNIPSGEDIPEFSEALITLEDGTIYLLSKGYDAEGSSPQWGGYRLNDKLTIEQGVDPTLWPGNGSLWKELKNHNIDMGTDGTLMDALSVIEKRQTMKVVDVHRSILECQVCGKRVFASIEPDNEGQYYSGSYECPNGCQFE